MTSQRISSRGFGVSGTIGNRIVAGLFLVYLAPVILVVALLLKFEANGPILIRRRRCLPNTGPVDMWEFRTTAPADDPSSPWSAETSGTLGNFLRVSRLDLLPRLVNMVRGEVNFGSLFR